LHQRLSMGRRRWSSIHFPFDKGRGGKAAKRRVYASVATGFGAYRTQITDVPMLNDACQRACYRTRLSKFGKALSTWKSQVTRCLGTHFLPALVATLSICRPGTTKNTDLSSSKAAVAVRPFACLAEGMMFDVSGALSRCRPDNRAVSGEWRN